MRQADEADYAEFYAAVWPRLFRLTYAISGDVGQAEDAVQSALAKAYASWHRMSSTRSPQAYVRRMAVNEVLSVRRRSWWKAERSGHVPDVTVSGSTEQEVVDRAELWERLIALAPRQRAVLVLRYYEDLSEQQIAEVLGCSRGTVKSQASDALATLRRLRGCHRPRRRGRAVMRLQDQLTLSITEQVATATQPVPDLADAVRRGRGMRRRRRLGAVAAIAVVVLGGATVLPQLSDLAAPEPETFSPVGQLDYSHGLRAFASPDEDGEVSIGGRSFPAEDMGFLDTDAIATPYGLVFFDKAMQAHLLTQDGTDLALAPAPPEQDNNVRLSAKADARLPLVAFTQPGENGVKVLLHRLDTGHTVDSIDVPCTGAECEEVRVDGLDRGLAFVRTGEGTFVWDPGAQGTKRWTLLGKDEFRVADVRNGRLLWAAAPPTPAPGSPVADWDFTRGEIDAELSYDGRHVLYWSSTLKPTEPGGKAIRLQTKDAIWFTFDTDGSVLAAANGSDQRSPVYDCELPSGTCEQIGSVSTRSGDPVFIGNDP
ncbi:MAG: SigE family RNA polymerase sigma factor [Microthrixaceae bacterium]